MSKKEIKILILGNGFDLAHGLPTSYIDFINFVEIFMACISQVKPESYIVAFAEEKVGVAGKNYLTELFTNADKLSIRCEFKELLSENIWYNYFLAKKTRTGGLWIDFETEISSVIQAIYSLAIAFKDEEAWKKSQQILVPHIFSDCPKQFNDLLKKRDILITDLRKFARALELYLEDFVNRIPVLKRIPEIYNNKFDKVICFNYTNTYERLYQKDEKTSIEYIHGKTQSISTVEKCNLVLGIDEFLDTTEDDIDTEFIEFKKFYQRIWNNTSGSYIKWIEDIEQNKLVAHIFIYGHSLDKTDKDILCPFINLELGRIKIYHHTKQAFGNQIKKLVKLLGEANLILKVYENRIEFIQQEELINDK
ncbi:MAG: hypothetical protein HDQ98_12205 [Lachnospiraceae bacterium]|nr:hypothetical protein [Lachnospiraceae bacterium]